MQKVKKLARKVKEKREKRNNAQNASSVVSSLSEKKKAKSESSTETRRQVWTRKMFATLLEVEFAYQTISGVMVIHRVTGKVVAKTSPEPDPIYDSDSDENTRVPGEYARMDDEALAGNCEQDDFVVAVCAATRFARNFAHETLVDEALRPSPISKSVPKPKSNLLFRVYGAASIFSCFCIGSEHLLIFFTDSISNRDDERAKPILSRVHLLLQGKDPTSTPTPPKVEETLDEKEEDDYIIEENLDYVSDDDLLKGDNYEPSDAFVKMTHSNLPLDPTHNYNAGVEEEKFGTNQPNHHHDNDQEDISTFRIIDEDENKTTEEEESQRTVPTDEDNLIV
mmetsp:Transcript_18712/g.22985  ORF Transcript_18712/g.22985 Transcript_18712/m.22985 type:complete len:338 (+) Transcript_18712:64-1077(+)